MGVRKTPLALVPSERAKKDRPEARPKARARAASPARAKSPAEFDKPLGSGRTLHVRSVDTGETIEIRSSEGEVEVSIVLGSGGPVVSVRAPRELEIASPHVAVRCDTLELEARKKVGLASDGEIKLKAKGDVVVNGAFVKLNCDEPGPAP